MPDELFFTAPAETPLYSPILLWGLDLVRAVQSIKSPALTFAMTLASDLLIVVIVLFALVLFWCIDEKKGIRLGLLLVVSAWINSFLKVLLKQPRPFNLDASVGLSHESSFGLPSGHSQMSLLFFTFFAAKYQGKTPRTKTIVWITAVFFTLLIAFSRIYLGVHFPTDAAAGWLIGGALLALFLRGEKRAALLLEAAGKRGQLIAAAMVSLLMLVVYPEDSSLAALGLGFSGGYALFFNSAPFSAQAPVNGKTPGFLIFFLRCLFGIAGTALIYLGLKFVFPGGSLFEDVPWWGPSSPYLELGRFIRYGILGLWISAGAPLLFGNLNLADNGKGSGD